jgi:4-amino-4-deoxy-L-arabinose transferase-like glycosyltransferase
MHEAIRIENSGGSPGGALSPAHAHVFCIAALSVLVILFALNSYVHLQYDTTPPLWDELKHMNYSFHFYRCLADGDLIRFFLFPPYDCYPPLQYYVTAVACLVFGPSYQAGVLTQLIFLPVLVICSYLISRRMWGDMAGFLAGFASFAFPLFSFMGHRFYLDIALCAMLSLALHLLLSSRGLTVPSRVIPFFIVCGLGLLTKASFPLYLLVPLLMTLLPELKRLGKEDAQEARAFVLGLAGFAGAVIISLLTADFLDIREGRPWESAGYYLLSILPIALYTIAVSRMKSRQEWPRKILIGLGIMALMVWHFYGVNYRVALSTSLGLARHGAGIAAADSFLGARTFQGLLMAYTIGTFGIPWLSFAGLGVALFLLGKAPRPPLWPFLGGGLFLAALLSLYPLTDPRYCLPGISFILPFAVLWAGRLRPSALRAITLALFLLAGVFGWLGYWLTPPSAGSLGANVYVNPRSFWLTPPGPARPVAGFKAWDVGRVSDTIALMQGDEESLVLISWQKDTPPYLRQKSVLVSLMYQTGRELYYVSRVRGADFSKRDWGTGEAYLAASPGKGSYSRLIMVEAGGEAGPALKQRLADGGLFPAREAHGKVVEDAGPVDFRVRQYRLPAPLPAKDVILDRSREIVNIRAGSRLPPT